MITTIIADDHSLIRDGLRALLTSTAKFDVIAMSESLPDLHEQILRSNPQLVILDISMLLPYELSALQEIKTMSPPSRIVILTFEQEAQHIHAALDAGVDAYLLKDDRQDDLFRAIEIALDGGTFLSPAITNKVVRGFINITKKQKAWDMLTNRERQVIKLIASGNRTRDIAESLSLSPKTVEKHRTNLMKKLELRNASEVTAFAIQNGFVD